MTPSRLAAMHRLWRLTPQEGRLFELLLLNRQLSRDEIVEGVDLKSKKHVHVVINHLRRKLKDVVEIENAWGIGYYIGLDDQTRLLHDLRVENGELESANN